MNLALNPFDKGKKPEKVEELELGSNYKWVLERYERMIQVFMHTPHNMCDGQVMQHVFIPYLKQEGLPVLSPYEIKLISQVPVVNMKWAREAFLCKLIMDSYNAGANKFTLFGRENGVGFHQSLLNGTQNKPLELKLESIYFAVDLSWNWCNVFVENAAPFYASKCRNCWFFYNKGSRKMYFDDKSNGSKLQKITKEEFDKMVEGFP